MKKKITLSEPLAKASGAIETTLKNDMMFHMVMSRSDLALKGLICALQGLEEEDVKSVTLLNPINYDEYLQKEIIVDTLVELNTKEVLNIEVQIERDKEWIKRSLLYLCRAYDNLMGEDREYARLKPTTHIGILDHDLFPEHREFYGKYLLKNVKDGHVYTDIFGMNVLSLNRTELATEEDKSNRLDYWAQVFKAETWEELRQLAERSEAMAETAELVYKVNADVHERSILRAHRKYQEVYATAMAGLKRAEAERDEAFTERDEAFTRLDEAFAKLDQKDAEIAELRRQLAEAKK